jgi:hypothetical protein
MTRRRTGGLATPDADLNDAMAVAIWEFTL